MFILFEHWLWASRFRSKSPCLLVQIQELLHGDGCPCWILPVVFVDDRLGPAVAVTAVAIAVGAEAVLRVGASTNHWWPFSIAILVYQSVMRVWQTRLVVWLRVTWTFACIFLETLGWVNIYDSSEPQIGMSSCFLYWHVGVSINGGTPKWSVYDGKSH